MHLPLWYYIVGAIIGVICVLLSIGHMNEEEQKQILKVPMLALLTIIFLISGFLWPIAVFLGFMALM